MHSKAVFSLISGLLMSSEAIFGNPMSICGSAGSVVVGDARISGNMLSAFCIGSPASAVHRWPGNLPGRMGTGSCSYHAPLCDTRIISMVPSKVVSRRGILVAMSSGEEEEGVSSTRGRKSGDPLGREKPMIFVGNLPWVLDSWGLEKLFEPFGKIVAAKISFDHETDRSRGYGFVVFEKLSDAKKALEAMGGKEVGGRRMDVQAAGLAPRVADRGGIDSRDLRVNPSNSDARYGQPGVSKEKEAFENTRLAMDLEFFEKFDDPKYNVAVDDWASIEIVDVDDELDWTDYRMNWDEYDAIAKEVKWGLGGQQQMRENGPGGPMINWDLDWIADPIQVLSDGRKYLVADPDRPVPEDFDRIFNENDERRAKELMDWDGTTNIDDLRVANRADGEGRQRRPGDMNNRLNIVDPFGKRTVRRGLRDRASEQMGSIEKMKEMENVLKKAGARLVEDKTYGGISKEEQARMREYEKASIRSNDDDTTMVGGRWSIKKKSDDLSSNDSVSPNSPVKDRYTPPKDGYTLMPPGKAVGGETGPGTSTKGIPRAAGLGRDPPTDSSLPPPSEKSSAAETSGGGGEVVKKSRGRPRKDGTPAQPRAKAGGEEDTATKRRTSKPMEDSGDDADA